jgi:hypothetical protein
VRIALLADVHGNTLALENVLKDAEAIGVEEYWFLGDYAAIGYDPVGVLERITNVPDARFIHGNTDRFLVTGELPWMRLDEAIKDLAHARTHVEVARSFAWTTGAVGTTGWLWWFSELSLDFRFTLPDGTRILACMPLRAPMMGWGSISIHPMKSYVSWSRNQKRILSWLDIRICLLTGWQEA